MQISALSNEPYREIQCMWLMQFGLGRIVMTTGSRAILVTGFTPFGGQRINASWEAARQLPHEVNGVRIIVRQIPVAYFKSIDAILEILAENEDITDVILLGEAGGRTRVSVEAIGVNLDDASIPDIEGVLRQGEKIAEGGPDGLFSTISAHKVVEHLITQNVPSYVSWSAGQYLCNHVLYGTLLKSPKTNTVFVHLPYTSEQGSKSSYAGLPVSELARSVEAVVEFVARS